MKIGTGPDKTKTQRELSVRTLTAESRCVDRGGLGPYAFRRFAWSCELNVRFVCQHDP